MSQILSSFSAPYFQKIPQIPWKLGGRSCWLLDAPHSQRGNAEAWRCQTGWCSRSRRHQHSGLSLYNCTTLELAIMLNLHLLVLMMGLSLEEEPLFQLNADGYIECYEDLDCPNPIEVEEDNTIIRFSCSGGHTVYSIPSQCTDMISKLCVDYMLRGNQLWANCTRHTTLQLKRNIHRLRRENQVKLFFNATHP